MGLDSKIDDESFMINKVVGEMIRHGMIIDLEPQYKYPDDRAKIDLSREFRDKIIREFDSRKGQKDAMEKSMIVAILEFYGVKGTDFDNLHTAIKIIYGFINHQIETS